MTPWSLWSTLVPLRASTFTSLHDEHPGCNLVTTTTGPFVGKWTDSGAVALCDHQTEPGGSILAQNGSGRAGVVGDHYLKGIGLTPLAANWQTEIDRAHGSGHLTASAAAREYVVTRWLARHGLGASIIPCDGILVAPLDERLARFDEVFGDGIAPRAPADLALQAITVKPAGFARWSNFLWLLDRMPVLGPGRERVVSPSTFLQMFAAALAPALPVAATSSPADIVERVRGAVATTLDAFRVFFAHGIFWSSVTGNFAIDGRFLDLELPLVTGAPIAGAYRTSLGDVPLGFEWLEGARYPRRCVKSFILRLRRFVQESELGGRVAEFFSEIDRGLEALLDDAASPIGPSPSAVACFLAMVEGVRPLTPEGRRVLGGVATTYFDGTAPRPSVEGIATRSTWLKQVSAEPCSVGDVTVFSGAFVDAPEPDRSVAAYWSALAAIDRATTVDTYLSNLRSVTTF